MKALFRAAQLNVHHSKAVSASLGQAAQEEHFDVVLIQEPPPWSMMERYIWPGFIIALATPSSLRSVIIYRATLGYMGCNFLVLWVCNSLIIDMH